MWLAGRRDRLKKRRVVSYGRPLEKNELRQIYRDLYFNSQDFESRFNFDRSSVLTYVQPAHRGTTHGVAYHQGGFSAVENYQPKDPAIQAVLTQGDRTNQIRHAVHFSIRNQR